MNVSQLAAACGFGVRAGEQALTREITGIYSCDLLSIAMSRLPAQSAWVTVMGNINTIAVASLADAACIVIAERMQPDEEALAKAKAQDIAVLASEAPVFDTCLAIKKAAGL